MADRDWIDRAFALLVIFVVLDVVLGPSQVGLNFWFVSGTLAIGMAFAYLVSLGLVFFEPKKPWGHLAATATGVGFWLGRAGGFIALASAGSTNLIPAAHERITWACLVVLWHLRAIQLIPLRPLLKDFLDSHGDAD